MATDRGFWGARVREDDSGNNNLTGLGWAGLGNSFMCNACVNHLAFFFSFLFFFQTKILSHVALLLVQQSLLPLLI